MTALKQKQIVFRTITSQIDHNIQDIDRLLSFISQQECLASKSQPQQIIPEQKICCEKRMHHCDRNGLENFSDNECKWSLKEKIVRSQITAYEFESISQNTIKQEQQLLDAYNFGVHYNSSYATIELLTFIPKISLSTKHNWISSYLDRKDDCLVQAVSHQSNSQNVIVNQVKNGIFTCHDQNQEVISISEEIFYEQNSEVVAMFPRHKKAITLKLNDKEEARVFQIEVRQVTRFIMAAGLKKKESLVRLVIFKQSQSSEGKKYEIVFGHYCYHQMMQAFILQQGVYVLKSFSQAPLHQIQLYVQDETSFSIHVDANDSPQKGYHLLANSFAECKELLQSEENDELSGEFVRSCYLDMGIIIEIYKNIYEEDVVFLEEVPLVEDKKLLFSQIYTRDEIRNKLRRNSLCIKFYEVTAKPARLFIPNLKVKLGSTAMKSVKIHSIFK